MKHLYVTTEWLREGFQAAHDLPRLRPVSLDAECRPNCAPAYYQGRPASLWINVMKPRRRRRGRGRECARQSRPSRHLQK
jgi:hypothetical protein